jgi:hypothetical protein
LRDRPRPGSMEMTMFDFVHRLSHGIIKKLSRTSVQGVI